MEESCVPLSGSPHVCVRTVSICQASSGRLYGGAVPCPGSLSSDSDTKTLARRESMTGFYGVKQEQSIRVHILFYSSQKQASIEKVMWRNENKLWVKIFYFNFYLNTIMKLL